MQEHGGEMIKKETEQLKNVSILSKGHSIYPSNITQSSSASWFCTRSQKKLSVASESFNHIVIYTISILIEL